jgi:hypothetical protein
VTLSANAGIAELHRDLGAILRLPSSRRLGQCSCIPSGLAKSEWKVNAFSRPNLPTASLPGAPVHLAPVSDLLIQSIPVGVVPRHHVHVDQGSQEDAYHLYTLSQSGKSTPFPDSQCLTPRRPGAPSALFQPLDPDQFPIPIKQCMVITLPQPKRWSTFFNRTIGRSGEWVHHCDQPGGWV